MSRAMSVKRTPGIGFMPNRFQYGDVAVATADQNQILENRFAVALQMSSLTRIRHKHWKNA